MPKLKDYGPYKDGKMYGFHCPGCKNDHAIDVPRWQFNGSMDSPTFSPSLLCNQHIPEHRCHSFIRDGMIQFLDDCHHELRGKTVPIPEWED